jgi:pimeloyl-ACP methyl ester carboxylesterase
MDAAFTPAHRGGSGEPLLLLHGFTDTWRTWELVLPVLEARHDVLAVTLAGHAGGPPLAG